MKQLKDNYLIVDREGYIENFNVTEKNKYDICSYLNECLKKGEFVFTHDGNRNDYHSWHGLVYLPEILTKMQQLVMNEILKIAGQMQSFITIGPDFDYQFKGQQNYLTAAPVFMNIKEETLKDILITNFSSISPSLECENIHVESDMIDASCYLMGINCFTSQCDPFSSFEKAVRYLLECHHIILYDVIDEPRLKTIILPHELSFYQRSLLYYLNESIKESIMSSSWVNGQNKIENFYNFQESPLYFIDYLNMSTNPSPVLTLKKIKEKQ